MPTSPSSTFGEVSSCHFFIDTNLSNLGPGSMLGGSSEDDVDGNGGRRFACKTATYDASEITDFSSIVWLSYETGTC